MPLFPVPISFIYAVTYFSPGEFSTSKSLRIIHWHQRGREWDCVWCSPRIAVCHRKLMCCIETEQCHRWLKTRLLRMNGGEHVHTHTRTSKQSKVPVLFGIVSMPHKQGQTPTSSLYWCVSGSGFSMTDVANSIWKEYFLLMRPLIQIPHKLGSCFTLCGLRPGFNPFYILCLLWRTTLCVPNKRMTEIPVLPILRTSSPLHTLLRVSLNMRCGQIILIATFCSKHQKWMLNVIVECYLICFRNLGICWKIRP